jgi:hypothetical protein
VFASTWENVRPTVVTATEVSRAKRYPVVVAAEVQSRNRSTT